MALRFDSAGTSLIVHQYLEKCRVSLRNRLSNEISSFFTTDIRD